MLKEELEKIIFQRDYPKSIPRQKYVKKISSWMERKEIIILKGVRRCGKTHIMYQLMQDLPKENIFYVNFDDFRLDSHLNIDLLEEIIKLRNPKKKCYFFFDEIQRIAGFEKWLRTYYDRELNIKFIIGGSSISLLSPEMGTVLTGRNMTFNIYPLSYEEFQKFSKETFETYLEFGGFPEVVMEQDKVKKRELLEQYVSDIISKDILTKYRLDNPKQLQAIVKFFLSNPGVKISANKLASQLGIHKDTAQKYIDYILDSFLVFEVPFFSYSAKTRYIASHASKYYLIDNGLHTIASIKKNESRLYENIAAIHIKTRNKEIMYWLGKREIDFVFDDIALQVTATDNIPEREMAAFKEFENNYKRFRNILVCPKREEIRDNLQIVPIKEFIVS